MIYYSPTNNDVLQNFITYRPKTCFLMTQLGGELSPKLKKIISDLKDHLKKAGIDIMDANSLVTGSDFLDKIFKLMLSVPIGIVVITEEMKTTTLSNIFYEIGIMTALGKEILVIKSKEFEIPSDLIRTEYVEYNKDFTDKIQKFLKGINEKVDYYKIMAEQLHKKALLSLDYYKRGYLITGDESIKISAKKIALSEDEKFDEHTKMMINSFLKSK